jgi:glycosyltransferase involved in cell wall biosynthesis
MIKKRILIANDASCLNTGYGIYGKEILTRLHNSGKYEVAELGCYIDKNNPVINNIPWKFYPNAVSGDDPEHQQYSSNSINQFGLWRFNKAVADFRPHIVFDVRDYWMFSYQETSPFRPFFNWVIMPTVDSAPQKFEWRYTFSNADMVVPYTQWAKKTLIRECGNSINLFNECAYAGINSHEFFPVEDKKNHKLQYFGKDITVIGAVMRNQKRKLLPDLMLAFKKYLELLKLNNLDEEYKKTYLYLHTSYPEENGWDIPALLLEYDIADKVYFSYLCRNCNAFLPSKFQGGLKRCIECNHYSSTIASPINGVNTSQLNEIYNLFDIFVQYAICEGFGMPQVEAAACGLKIASVNYSAMSEIVEDLHGISLPVQRMFRETETNADRAYPDIDATAHKLYEYLISTSPQQKEEEKTIIRNKCISKYTWDNVYKTWDSCFDSFDIKNKVDWNAPALETNHNNVKIPENLTHKEFVEYICYHVLKAPYILNSAATQCLIKDLSMGLVAGGGSIKSISRDQAIKILENHLNNILYSNELRLNKKEKF